MLVSKSQNTEYLIHHTVWEARLGTVSTQMALENGTDLRGKAQFFPWSRGWGDRELLQDSVEVKCEISCQGNSVSWGLCRRHCPGQM